MTAKILRTLSSSKLTRNSKGILKDTEEPAPFLGKQMKHDENHRVYKVVIYDKGVIENLPERRSKLRIVYFV
jgi:hypothetical protein